MNSATEQGFGIGVVARRTGLTTSNIRMWEARYRAVDPERTASNRRLYSAEDIERLTLLRSLTQRGHAIGSIAHLGLEDLQSRLAEEETAAPPSSSRVGALLVGNSLQQALASGRIPELDVVARFEEIPEVVQAADVPGAELVVIETQTLFPETIPDVRRIIGRTKASRSILVYHFATSKTATALARAIPGLHLLKAPISEDQLVRECMVQFSALAPRETTIPIESRF